MGDFGNSNTNRPFSGSDAERETLSSPVRNGDVALVACREREERCRDVPLARAHTLGDKLEELGTTREEERERLYIGSGEVSSRPSSLKRGSGVQQRGRVRLGERASRWCTFGERGSGERQMETPLMYSVGELGIPVSDSYSLELCPSNLAEWEM